MSFPISLFDISCVILISRGGNCAAKEPTKQICLVNKKTSLLNYVPFVPMCFTCLCALCALPALTAYVSLCLKLLPTLNYYMNTCPHFSRAYVQKVQNNVKTSWKYNLVPSLPSKKKIMSIQRKAL